MPVCGWVCCWHAHNTRFVSVRILLVILSHSLSSCLCLSPSESLYFCTRFFSSGFLVSYPVLIRFVSFTIWCLLMNVSRLLFLSTSTARLYLLYCLSSLVSAIFFLIVVCSRSCQGLASRIHDCALLCHASVHKLALPKLASCSRSAPSSSHQTQSLLAACLVTARRCTFM